MELGKPVLFKEQRKASIKYSWDIRKGNDAESGWRGRQWPDQRRPLSLLSSLAVVQLLLLSPFYLFSRNFGPTELSAGRQGNRERCIYISKRLLWL